MALNKVLATIVVDLGGGEKAECSNEMYEEDEEQRGSDDEEKLAGRGPPKTPEYWVQALDIECALRGKVDGKYTYQAELCITRLKNSEDSEVQASIVRLKAHLERCTNAMKLREMEAGLGPLGVRQAFPGTALQRLSPRFLHGPRRNDGRLQEMVRGTSIILCPAVVVIVVAIVVLVVVVVVVVGIVVVIVVIVVVVVVVVVVRVVIVAEVIVVVFVEVVGVESIVAITVVVVAEVILEFGIVFFVVLFVVVVVVGVVVVTYSSCSYSS